MRYRSPALLAFFALFLSGCATPTDRYASISTRLEVTPTAAGAGDTILLRAMAFNSGSETVHLTRGCGPGLNFEIRHPSGDLRQVFGGGPSTCEMQDYQVLLPLETDTIEYRWPAPPVPGTYRIVAGVRTATGIAAPSETVAVAVAAD